ncbi:globin-coupled sensor protein [Segnochrobactrum spirostomi]|uniref:Methyl-accepting transducer domain-containing protein n=1 Tax=Segnochrobactrum spirostomi TaxID=2608987 RepID=A0A6A7Y2X9_9HYPH|nr:globin-coupled sensor protein [Segnochrobactrum spirostomi]MQT12727.1 hypothetical protein [Segnochrobactrum spirostomi]
MSAEIDFDVQKHMLLIDEDVCRDLKDAWKLFEPELPSIVGRFYRHLAEIPETASLIAGRVERLAEAQRQHWTRLFTSGFDAGYRESVRAIGRAHVRVGLHPGIFISAYGLIGSEFPAIVNRVHRLNSARAARLLSATIKAVMLDMNLAVSVYHDETLAEAERRRAKLAEHLAAFDAAFGGSLNSLNNAAETMRDASGRLVSLSSQSSDQAVGASSTASEMADRAVEGAEAVNSITHSIESVAGHARASLGVVGKAVDQARAMDGTVRDLTSAAERIDRVVELIAGIAGQTNLLALNATIEAARAGDAGRGFDVVAREVKTLATQTAAATKEISSEIGSIQSATHAAADGLTAIASTIEQVASAIEQISAAVNEQTDTTRAIASTVAALSSDARGVVTSITNVRTATDTTGQVVATVRDLAANLDDQASRMKTEVRSFFERVAAA